MPSQQISDPLSHRLFPHSAFSFTIPIQAASRGLAFQRAYKTSASRILESLSLHHQREMDVTMTDIGAMNATLRNMQEEMEKLSRLLHCLFQAATVIERLVRVSDDLQAVLDQLHMHGNDMQCSVVPQPAGWPV